MDDVQRARHGCPRLTLVALYNRERDPDGPGGTAHLVEVAAKWGFKTVELDARELLEGVNDKAIYSGDAENRVGRHIK
jgi:hypothetical protein